MTALDILKKHFEKAKETYPHENWVDDIITYKIELEFVLSALREITEKTWEEAINYDRYQHPYPSKDEFLKELFPEK